MLELTISDSEKLLLERTNLFNKNNIISFCLLLSYGNLNGLETLSEKKIAQVEVKVKEKLELLESKIINYKEIRIWYSNNDNENMCTVCYLINYLSKYNLNIYLCDVKEEGRFALGCYSEDEIENMLPRTKLLTEVEKNKYINLWYKLKNQNSDLRIVENNTIKSYNFDYLDNKILELLSKEKIIKYWEFIGKCMMNRIYNFSSDFYFKDRIDYLIKKGVIKIDKIVNEENFFGKKQLTKYISINKL